MNVDDELTALVEAEPVHDGPPDLVALRDRGRQRLRHRRTAIGGAAVAVVLVVVGVPTYLTFGDDDGGTGSEQSFTDTSRSAEPSADASDRAERFAWPEPGSLPVGGDDLTGEWEDGTVLGEPLLLGRLGGHEQVLYAARRLTDPNAEEETTYVALGLRSEGRILRTVTALVPADQTAPDGIDLYGGDRLEAPFVDPGSGPQYRLLGVVPGDVEVTIAPDGAVERPVTASSTDVLEGYTVFVDTAPWDQGWDPAQLAPLVVTTDAGAEVAVRERSRVG